jgi:hypothetical protein
MSFELTPISVEPVGVPTPTDCAVFGYEDLPEWAILRAWTRIKSYTRQQIIAGSSSIALDFPYRLPQRPVRSITSVTQDGADVTYALKGGGFLALTDTTGSVDVIYEHGYDALPPELVEIVASVANRMTVSPDSLAQGVRSEAVGQESVTWGADAYSGTTDLTSAEKGVLDRIFALKMPSVAAMDPP